MQEEIFSSVSLGGLPLWLCGRKKGGPCKITEIKTKKKEKEDPEITARREEEDRLKEEERKQRRRRERIGFPSLHDLLERRAKIDVTNEFMEVASTWPRTRLHMLQVLLEVLQVRIPATRFLKHLKSVFAIVQPALARGVSGTVYKACVNKSEREEERKVCQRFMIPEVDMRRAHEIPLIVKNMVGQALRDTPRDSFPSYYCWSRSGECTGYDNAIRETLTGRFLNLLVKKNITPHLPVIYEFFQSRFIEDEPVTAGKAPKYLSGDPCVCIATEMCHMTFSQFMDMVVENCIDDANIPRLLNVAFLQLMHGLACAQKHLNFRHNDFHTNNAMMTYITSGKYCYRMDGYYYEIPNYGMCWKLIDFGFSSSTELFGDHDNGSMLVCTHALSVAESYGVNTKCQATEMYDVIRFIAAAIFKARRKQTLMAGGSPRLHARLQVFIDYFNEKLGLCRKIFLDEHSEHGRKDLVAAHALRHAIGVAHGDEASRRAHARMASSNAGSGLVQQFFTELAEEFRKEEPRDDDGEEFDGDASHVVFDADKSFFKGYEPLSGIEAQFYAVDETGRLVQAQAHAGKERAKAATVQTAAGVPKPTSPGASSPGIIRRREEAVVKESSPRRATSTRGPKASSPG